MAPGAATDAEARFHAGRQSGWLFSVDCPTHVAGIWCVFRDKVQKAINKLRLVEPLTGNFNSLMSKKNPCSF
jgi:hypothetical protein